MPNCSIIFPPQCFHGLFCKVRNSELVAMWFPDKYLFENSILYTKEECETWWVMADTGTVPLPLWIVAQLGDSHIFLATCCHSLVSTSDSHPGMNLSPIRCQTEYGDFFVTYTGDATGGVYWRRLRMLPNISQYIGQPSKHFLSYNQVLGLGNPDKDISLIGVRQNPKYF